MLPTGYDDECDNETAKVIRNVSISLKRSKIAYSMKNQKSKGGSDARQMRLFSQAYFDFDCLGLPSEERPGLRHVLDSEINSRLTVDQKATWLTCQLIFLRAVSRTSYTRLHSESN